jgi:hypothetical protein
MKAPSRPPQKLEPRAALNTPAAIKIQHLLNALDEVRKAWLPPLSTDPKEVQENKLKEINYFINLSHVITEAVNIAS